MAEEYTPMPYQEQIAAALEDGHVLCIKGGQSASQTFREDFLAGIAQALNVPVHLMSHDWHMSPDMPRVKALIDRAALAHVHRKRGYDRKLKRARRLQMQFKGRHYSKGWFVMQWEWAVSRHRRERYVQDMITRGGMVLTALSASFAQQLTGLRPVYHYRPGEGFVPQDEVDYYGR